MMNSLRQTVFSCTFAIIATLLSPCTTADAGEEYRRACEKTEHEGVVSPGFQTRFEERGDRVHQSDRDAGIELPNRFLHGGDEMLGVER